uniref:Fatty acyl-CoA reductase n=1 Tax=Oryza rufipogon TaxID=4529 RepID=A0A0E0PVS6_ORYRU
MLRPHSPPPPIPLDQAPPPSSPYRHRPEPDDGVSSTLLRPHLAEFRWTYLDLRTSCRAFHRELGGSAHEAPVLPTDGLPDAFPWIDHDAVSPVKNQLVLVVQRVRGATAKKASGVITDEVDIIVNSAANNTFDERYDVAMDINTVGPFRIMSFPQRAKLHGWQDTYVFTKAMGEMVINSMCFSVYPAQLILFYVIVSGSFYHDCLCM